MAVVQIEEWLGANSMKELINIELNKLTSLVSLPCATLLFAFRS